jgi:chaperonin GroES
MAKVKPLGEKIVVKRLEAKEKSAGGIVLPDAAKEKPQEGRVVALGEGRLLEDGKRVPFSVKVGDRVIFASYAGSEIKLEGEEHLILQEDDIFVVVE